MIAVILCVYNGYDLIRKSWEILNIYKLIQDDSLIANRWNFG